MFAEQFGFNAVVIALSLALAPAVLRWWWGRALSGLTDHPLIAERLLVHHSRVGIVVAGCLILGPVHRYPADTSLTG